jgi:hypothetical protein
VFKEVLVQLNKLGGKRISDSPSKPELSTATALCEGSSPASECKSALVAELIALSAVASVVIGFSLIRFTTEEMYASCCFC